MNKLPLRKISAWATEVDGARSDASEETVSTPSAEVEPHSIGWRQWFTALQAVLPLYIAVHIAFLVTAFLAPLFTVKDFSPQSWPLSTLWQSWRHWDTGNYIGIAVNGYHDKLQTAFFPLYPMLERGLMALGIDPLIAGLLISNIAGLVLLIVLYRLVEEEFDAERAFCTVLYLSLFPTAFFLAAGYNESLFICLSLLSFYHIRHAHWWLAGVFGLCACLTRSIGIFLLVPFFYEYIRRHGFRIKTMQLDIMGGVLPLAGICLYGLYCYFRFHDFLAFSHAEAYWTRTLHGPWHGIIGSLKAILISGGLLSFQSIRNILDLVPDLFLFFLLLLSFAGPWKFPRKLWVYGIYGIIVWVFLQLFPTGGVGLYPLESMSRYMLELFPAFIILAALGRRFHTLHLCYLMISGAILFFLLTQFLTGHWVL